MSYVIATPSITTFINGYTGVYSFLPNSYITNLVYNPSNVPTNPRVGEHYYDIDENLVCFWDGTKWVCPGSGNTGARGPQGNVGSSFVIFNNTTSYTGLNGIIATGGNIGQYVLIKGGDLFVYVGTGAGSTGPGNSYIYSGDLTDESKIIGPQGYQGFKGDVGQGFVIFNTTYSYTGLNGIIATGGNIGEFVLITGGDLFVYVGTGAGSTGPGNSYNYAGDITDESKLIGFQGNQGFQGVVGVTGALGLQGYQGIPGINGVQGFQGLIGVTGLQGFQGLQGLAGSTGVNGLQGFQGLQGLAGSTGINGVQGFQGLIGVTGPIGLQGLQGLAGSTGINGVQGFQGLIGVTGSVGSQGLQGINGLQGFQGLRGFTGAGFQGPQGFQGLQGTTGVQGFQGGLGPQGVAGVVGPTGTLTATVTFSQGQNIPVNTNIDNYLLGPEAVFLMTGTAGIDFNGFTGGSPGRFIVVINSSLSNVVFKQEAPTSIATNRLSLGTNQITVNPNSVITFIYGLSTLGYRWLCLSKQ